MSKASVPVYEKRSVGSVQETTSYRCLHLAEQYRESFGAGAWTEARRELFSSTEEVSQRRQRWTRVLQNE